jgi:RimJ/RimL family protein N-acetyltransferase
MLFQPIREEHFLLVERWVADDAVGGPMFGGFYGQARDQWKPLLRPRQRHGWIAYAGGEPVGFVDLDITDGVAEATYYICPYRRGRRHGVATAKNLASIAANCGASTVRASVEPSNLRSLRCLRAANLAEAGVNEFGEIMFVARGSKAPSPPDDPEQRPPAVSSGRPQLADSRSAKPVWRARWHLPSWLRGADSRHLLHTRLPRPVVTHRLVLDDLAQSLPIARLLSRTYVDGMKKPLRCRLGVHTGRTDRNDEGQRYLTCERCGTNRHKITLNDFSS